MPVWKRTISLLLALVIAAGMLPPLGAYASELEPLPEAETAPVTEETGTAAPETEAPQTANPAEEETATIPVVEEAETDPAETTAPAEEAAAPATEPAAVTQAEELFSGETVTEEVFFTETVEDNSEALFEGYLNRLFFGNGGILPLGTLARDTLSPADQYLYDELKKVIVLIAAGQRESTMVEVEFAGTGFSCADTDFSLVVDCLIHDCPYEMYWYSYAYWSHRQGRLVAWLEPCKNYRPADFDEDDPTINTEKAAKATAAAENARAILASYASCADYDKLAGYADTICSLVKYNNSAASNNTWRTNINPWTLVNVFDNDKSTNVVCEGYAEAFQYLCDQSVFDRDVACYSPIGANHKWNIVRIDGVSYLMDVTFCDIGKTAERGDYFLGGGEGSVESGYIIGGFHYWYYDETLNLWGAGEDSILKLSETAYDPASAQEPETVSQEKFEAALENCGGSYCLTKSLCLSADLTLSGVALTLGAGGAVSIPAGVRLTVAGDASLTLEDGGRADVQGSLIAVGPVAHNGGLTGAGTVLLADFEEDTGMLTLSGWGTVSDGDLDGLSNAQYLLVEQGITAIGPGSFDGFDRLEEVSLSEGVTALGAKAFRSCQSLWTVNIPASVEALEDGAFSNCTGLKEITFQGDAPVFGEAVFEGVTANCYYPAGNETWTEAVMQQFGENLIWTAACTNGHTVVTVPGVPPTCVDYGLADGAYCSVCGETLAEQTLLMPTGIHTYTDETDTVCDVCGAELILEEEFPFTKYEWEVLKLTNRKRAAAGVAPLTGFTKLQQAGDIRAEELGSLFSHTRPNGESCFTVLKEMELEYWYAGENIASGYKTPAAVVGGWMDSPGHRENMLNPDFSHMGVGEKNKNWVQLFISGASYASIKLSSGDRLTLDPGTDLDDLDLVGVLMGRWGMCYLPVFADYCEGYDPNALGDQTVTLSVLGVSTTFTVHIHDWTEATCTEPKTCPTCGETSGEALGHTYKKTVVPPTCLEGGYTNSTCTVCGSTQTGEETPALGHDVVTDAAVAPTCTRSGLTEGSHCARCGEILEEQILLDALGHTVIVDAGHAPTCIRSGLSDGQHCGVCGDVLLAQTILPATGHDFSGGFCRSCGAEDKPDYILFSGKSLTLIASHPDTGRQLTAKQVAWSVEEEFAPFASVNKNGRLTAKKVFEKVRIEAVATLVSNGETVTYLVDIFPVITQAEVTARDKLVNGKTVLMDFAEESLTLRADAYPLDTLAEVTWTVSDKKNQYAEYAIDGNTLTITNPTGKAGTVTIKATVNAGVKKTVTVKVQFGSFAKTVEIAEPEKTTIRGGETLVLSAAITEPETVTKSGIIWSVSDKNAATVSGGKVKAKNVAHPTTVTVTATSKDGQASASVDLEIIPKNEGQLVLMAGDTFVTNATKALNVGESLSITAAVITNGDPIPTDATWTTSKATVATVSDGMITAAGAGTAKITAEYNGMKAVLNIKVSTLVADMEITTKDGKNIIEENGEKIVVVSSGKGVNLVANILTAGANKAVTWEITEGAEFAKLSSSGKLTANKDLTKPAYVTVKATAKDGSGTSASIRVKIVPLATGVQIFQNGTRVRSNTVYVCDLLTSPTLKLNAKVYPAKANQAVQLTSSNKRVADFNENGELVCFKTGTVTITAKALDGSNAKTTFKLTIIKRVTSLSLKEGLALDKNGNVFVAGGKSLKLAPMVQISPSDATNKKLTWKVSDNDYGIKISSSGVLTTKKVTQPVTVNIMVTTQDGSGHLLSFDVTVNPK